MTLPFINYQSHNDSISWRRLVVSSGDSLLVCNRLT